MKKLVMFTLAIVFALGVPMMAFGQGFFPVTPLVDDIDHNAVAVDQAVAVVADVDVDVNKDFNSHNKTKIASDNTFDSNDDNSIRDSRRNYNNFQPTDSLNDNSTNVNVVDNNILANVNIAADKKRHGGAPNQVEATFALPWPGEQKDECCPEVSQTNTLTQIKTQSASIAGFNCATGVSNANAAGGNMNAQTAYTTVGVAFVK